VHILFLGPACPPIETYFYEKGYTFVRMEEALSLAWVREQNFAFGLSYRYKNIIRKDIIEYFAGKLINMHISFLPWNRGYDPNLWSCIEETPKGVTIHRVDAGIDTGDILLQQEIPIDQETDTLRTSYEKLSRAIEELFISNAGALLANEIPATAQTGAGSFHLAKDKLPYLHFFDRLGFDTQFSEIIKNLRWGGGVKELFNLFKYITAGCKALYGCAV
jgi:methionyl-tRNA formyltransferase